MTRTHLDYFFLRALSRSPVAKDYASKGYEYEQGHEFDYALDAYPDLLKDVAGKDVIDYGAGTGAQSVAFARAGARHVVAVEPQRALWSTITKRGNLAGVDAKVSIVPSATHLEAEEYTADMIFAENSAEHYPNPGAELERMATLLAPGGRIVIIFPPWYGPEGAHCQHFTRMRWVNVLFSERAVHQVAALYRPAKTTAERSPAGCNRMTLARFEWLADLLCAEHGLTVSYKRLDASGGLPSWLTRIPLLREMFTSRATFVFERVP